MLAFNGLDYAILVVIVVSALISLKRGFIKEVLSLLIWLLAIVLSVMFHEQLAVLFQPYIDSPSLRKLLALLTLFIFCLVVGGLFNFILAKLVQITGLSGTDRLLGMIFGALRGAVIIVVCLMLGLTVLPLDQEGWWQQSVLVPHFQRMESWVMTQGLAVRDFVMPLLTQTEISSGIQEEIKSGVSSQIKTQVHEAIKCAAAGNTSCD